MKGESGEERKGNQERNERGIRRGTKGKPREEWKGNQERDKREIKKESGEK